MTIKGFPDSPAGSQSQNYQSLGWIDQPDAPLDGISKNVATRTRDGVTSIMSKSSCLRDGATHCD